MDDLQIVRSTVGRKHGERELRVRGTSQGSSDIITAVGSFEEVILRVVAVEQYTPLEFDKESILGTGR